MTQHTTNYASTFITVAPDSTATAGMAPPIGAKPSVAARTYALLANAPYRYSSDDVIFTVWADRNDVADADRAAAREVFFSKGQPCLRASDLGKKYGWGIHFDHEGRATVYGVDTPEYAELAHGRAPDGSAVTVKAAMRSRRS